MRCRICNKLQPPDPEVIILEEKMFQTNEPFKYIKCNQCKSVFIDKTPESMDVYYPKNYGPHKSLAKESSAMLQIYWRSISNLLFPTSFSYLPKGTRSTARILDFGAGNGNAALSVYERGFPRVTAIDAFAPQTISYHGGRLVVERKSTVDFPDESFDFIMAHHVLEHVKDPNYTLKELRRITKVGGQILIRVPFCDSQNAMYYNKSWAGFDPPRHLNNFSSEGLIALAYRCVLKPTHLFYDEALYGHWISEVWAEDGNVEDYKGVQNLIDKFGIHKVNSWYEKCNEANRKGFGDAGGVYMKREVK